MGNGSMWRALDISLANTGSPEVSDGEWKHVEGVAKRKVPAPKCDKIEPYRA